MTYRYDKNNKKMTYTYDKNGLFLVRVEGGGIAIN